MQPAILTLFLNTKDYAPVIGRGVFARRKRQTRKPSRTRAIARGTRRS